MVTDKDAVCQGDGIGLRESFEEKIRGGVLGKEGTFRVWVRQRDDVPMRHLVLEDGNNPTPALEDVTQPGNDQLCRVRGKKLPETNFRRSQGISNEVAAVFSLLRRHEHKRRTPTVRRMLGERKRPKVVRPQNAVRLEGEKR